MDSPTPEPHRQAGGDPGVLPDDLVDHLRGALLSFFDAHARDLPWRERGTADPYRVWVSEVMLQQTRVETVVPYYERWMERFPDVESLAEADLDEVLKHWEGLGYYRRARMLHRAAIQVRDGGGALPDTVEALRELPGVGAYTAGAVASIAFGHREPAVDGNVRRVLARVLDLPDPSPSELRTLAGRLVPPERPGDFNQALMELGATVCTPRSPECGSCPLAAPCRARALGVQRERPAPRRRPDVPAAEYGVAVPVRRGENAWTAAVVRRPRHGMLGGLWEFPGARVEAAEEAEAAARRAAGKHGIAVEGPLRALPVVDHRYSHLEARYRPYLFRASEDGGPPGAAPPSWMDADDLADAALPRAQRIIVGLLAEALDRQGEAC